MKKYLFIFLYIFISFSSFANAQQESLSEIQMDSHFNQILRNHGQGFERFIDLLQQERWGSDPHIFTWIDGLIKLNNLDIDLALISLMTEDSRIKILNQKDMSRWISIFLERNNPDINSRLIVLLIQDRWVNSSNQEEVLPWIATLIRHELADNKEVTAMFEEEPWKSHFTSNIARQTQENMVSQSMDFKSAIGHASTGFFISSFNNDSDLKSHPQLFTWTTTILTTWPYKHLLTSIKNAFATTDKLEYSEQSQLHDTWRHFDNLEQLTEVLLTKQIGTLSLRVEFLKILPRTDDPRIFDWLLIAANTPASRQVYANLTHILRLYVMQEYLFDSSSSQDKSNNIETSLKVLDLLVQHQPISDYHYEFQEADHRFTTIIRDLATDTGLHDPRIQERIGQILQRRNLYFSTAISLLKDPVWRENPAALNLLVQLTQPPTDRRYLHNLYFEWNPEHVKALLDDPFWQNHPKVKELELKSRLERLNENDQPATRTLLTRALRYLNYFRERCAAALF